MPVNVEDKIKRLGAAQREKVEARAAELITEEMSLRDLRKARKMTQRPQSEEARGHDRGDGWEPGADH